MRKFLGVLAVVALGAVTLAPTLAGAEQSGARKTGDVPGQAAGQPKSSSEDSQSDAKKSRSAAGTRLGAGITAGVLGAILLTETLKPKDGEAASPQGQPRQ